MQYLLPLAVAGSTSSPVVQQPKRPHVDPPPAPPGGNLVRDPKGNKLKKPKKDKIQIVIPDGCASRDAQGRPNCFGFNLGKCDLKVTKGRCAKGFHNCWKVGCNKPHPFTECPMGHQ